MAPSDVWNFFSKCVNNASKAQCTLCKKIVSRGANNYRDFSTSNLSLHLESNHYLTYIQFKCKHKDSTHDLNRQKLQNTGSHIDVNYADKSETFEVASTREAYNDSMQEKNKMTESKKQVSLPSLLKMKTVLPYYSARSQKINDLIGKMLTTHLLPFSHVENSGLVELMNYLEPRYIIPNRTTFSRTIIPHQYGKVVAKLIKVVKVAKHLSFTTDLWSPINTTDYLWITCHFVDSMFQRQNILLEIIPYRTSCNSGDEIYEFIIRSLEQWKIDLNNVHVFVHNNDSIMEKASHCQNYESVSCTTHTMQLAINDVLVKEKHHEELCIKVRSVVGLFKHSIRANKLLKNFQSKNKIPVLKFIQNVCSTKWDSKYLMLSRFLEQKKCVLGLAPLINLKIMFSDDDWTMLEGLVKTLEIFHSATLILSNENSTLSEVIPLLKSIFVSLETVKDVSNKCSEIANTFILKLKEWFNNYERGELLSISTILDPRFKDKVFSSVEIVQFSRENLLNKLKFVYTIMGQSLTDFPVCQIDIQTVQTSTKSNMTIFSNILPDKTSNVEQFTPDKEMQTYLKEDLYNVNGDIFQYWAESKFKGLKILAEKYHSCPSSFVDSEQSFSTAGLLYSSKRNSLNPEKVRQLIFLYKNQKYL